MRELGDDLAAADGADPVATRQFIAELAVELAHRGLVEGVDELLEAINASVARPGVRRQLPARTDREEVVDGVLHLITEIEVNRQSLIDMTGGEASLAELAPPDSCTGRRLQLDRPARVVSIPAGDLSFAVRCADPELVSWLRQISGATAVRGPIVAFVTSVEVVPGRVRFAVYDQDGYLVAASTDRTAIRTMILGLLPNHLNLSGPEGHVPLRAHVVSRGDAAILAPLGSLTRPRGLLRALDRVQSQLLGTRRPFVRADGTSVAVARIPDPYHPTQVAWDHYRLTGVWGRRTGDGEVDDAQRAMTVIYDATAETQDQRAAVLHIGHVIATSVPVTIADRAERSTKVIVTAIDELLT